tara:strand:- start:464 stop:670 length:207 start_codon:yes stop_codon:yes gene_type:complete
MFINPINLVSTTIDSQVKFLNQLNDIAKKNSVKELHTYMDKTVETVTEMSKYAKEILETNIKLFNNSK